MAHMENPGAGYAGAPDADVVGFPRSTSSRIANNEPAPQGRKEWRRHFIIRRRADWLRDVMASDLGAPPKCAAYALATYLNEKTMTAAPRGGLGELACDAGMSTRRLSAAIGELVAAGYLLRRRRGTIENEYVAIERGDDRTNPSSQSGSNEKTETSSQGTPNDRTNPSSQECRNKKNDRTETSSLSSPCEDKSGTHDKTFSVPCEDVFGRLIGRKRPHLYSDNSDNSDGGARQSASAADTVSPQCRENRLYRKSSVELARAERARSTEEEIPPLAGTENPAPEQGPRDVEFLQVLDGGGVPIETGDARPPLPPARPITDARYLAWAVDQPRTFDHLDLL